MPFTVAPEIVKLDPPELDRLSVWVWLPPTTTLPRFMLAGAVR